MQVLSLPSARRPAPAAVGGGRHGGGLPHVGHKPLTHGERDTTLGWDHRKLPFQLLLVYMRARILIPLHDPRLMSHKIPSTFTCMSVSAHMSLVESHEKITEIFILYRYLSLLSLYLNSMSPFITTGPVSP